MTRSPFDILDELNRTDEVERIEAKDSRRGTIGKSVYKTLSAFANTPGLGGGYLLFGVAPNGEEDRYEPVGVSDPDKLQTSLGSMCDEFNVRIRPKVQVEERNEICLISAFIPEAAPGDKPIYREVTGMPKGAYLRVGSSDKRCTDHDISDLHEHGRRQFYDERPVRTARFPEDFSDEAIDRYRNTLQRRKPNSELLNVGDGELLHALGCVVTKDQGWSPTVAGLILFGNKLALRREFPTSARVDYIRVPGTSWVEDPEQRYESIEFREALVVEVGRVVSAILDDIPRSVSITGDTLERRETPRVPATVVREAVVNAVMHRNYRKSQPTQILRFSNRIEIKNAGYSLKPIEQLGETRSVPRNPRIASVLHDLQLAETKGTGIQAMQREMKKAGLSPPVFRSDPSDDQFEVVFGLKHFLSSVDVDWLAKLDADWELDDDEKYALAYVRQNGTISNRELRSIADYDTFKASRVLSRLRELGFLERESGGADTFYTPGPNLRQATGSAVIPGQARLDEVARPTLFDDEHDKLDDEHDKLGDEHDKLGDEHDKLDGEHDKLAGFDGATRELIQDIRGSKRSTRIREAILHMCSQKPLSSKQLATLLERNRRSLNTSHLTPMVEEGRLRRLYPGSPRHPNQKYITVSDEE